MVDEAIAKDDKDAFAHYVAAVVATWKKDYERWTLESDKALAFNPNYALALLTRGNVHIYTGEPTKAIPYIERAMRLDPPTGPQQGQYVHFLGTTYFGRRIRDRGDLLQGSHHDQSDHGLVSRFPGVSVGTFGSQRGISAGVARAQGDQSSILLRGSFCSTAV